MAWMDKPGTHPDWLALDIRHPNEAKAFCQAFGERWLAIPYIEVRTRQGEIPYDRTLIIICDAGTRSYEIQCLLDGRGRRDSLVLAGGFNLVRRLPASWWPK